MLAVAEAPLLADESGLVHRYLNWLPQASGFERAEAVSALARAYLHCGLKVETRRQAEIALIAALDDADARVRRALAEAFASAREAPRAILLALLNDRSDIARAVLALSPRLTDADLVDAAAVGDVVAQTAIARRPGLSAPVAAALAEVGEPRAAMALIGNLEADIGRPALWRLFERFSGRAEMRARLIDRPGLPASLRAAIAAATSAEVADFAQSLEAVDPRRAERIARDDREQAFAAIAADASLDDLADLVRWLRQGDHLTVGLLMRSLAGGDLGLLRQSFIEMSGVAPRRVAGLVRDPNGHGFAAIYRKAGLPAPLLPAFRIAAHCAGQAQGRSVGVNHAMTQTMIAAIEARNDAALAPTMAMLWRLASESAREEAREFAALALAPPESPGVFFEEAHAAPPVLMLNVEASNENLAPPIVLDAPVDDKVAA